MFMSLPSDNATKQTGEFTVDGYIPINLMWPSLRKLPSVIGKIVDAYMKAF
jgi:hypothetical protein